MQCTWPQLARLALQNTVRPRLGTHIAPRSSYSWFKTRFAPGPIFSPTTFSRKYASTSAQMQAVPMLRRLINSPFPTSLSPSAQEKGIMLDQDPTTYTEKFVELEQEPTTHAQTGRIAAKAIRISVQHQNLSDAFLIVKALHSAHLGKNKATPAVQQFLGDIKDIPLVFDNKVSPRLASHALLHALIRTGSIWEASKLAELMMEQAIRVRCKTLEVIMLGLQRIALEHDQGGLFSPLFSYKSKESLRLKPMMSGTNAITGHAISLLQAARDSGQRRSRRMYRYLITLCIINGEIILASLLFGILLRDWQARELKKAATVNTPPQHQAPFPDVVLMKEICESLRSNLTADQTDERSQFTFNVSLQALVNLASFLDQRLIPFNVDVLLSTIYRCPSSRVKVLIPGKSILDPIDYGSAYGYLHSVLDGLIDNLPSHKIDLDLPLPHAGDALPPLNLASYNALLHYSLHERHSLKRARKVLLHMTAQRYEPIDPNNLVTLNIFERSLSQFPKGGLPELMAEIGINGPPSLLELAKMPDDQLDLYALSTAITSLINDGRPSEVLDALPAIIPGLFPPIYDNSLPLDTIAMIWKTHREECIQRATHLGPVVFTSIINAARKAGRTGLAEQVFLYALEAESNSWNLPAKGGLTIRPWCLPVHAYTAMIQVYGNEMKKGPRSHSNGSSNMFAEGWGLTVDGRRLKHEEAKIPRHKLGRRMVILTYRLMKAAPQKIELCLREAKYKNYKVDVFKRRLEPPIPDKWVFGVLLKIFARTPWDPIFPSLKKEMIEARFEVPTGFQNMLQEYWPVEAEEGTEHNDSLRIHRDTRPIAFPRFDGNTALGEGAVAVPVILTKRYVPSPKMLDFQKANRQARSQEKDTSNSETDPEI